MAENIDSLQIEISANASSAEKSIERLAESLLHLQKTINGFSGFKNLSLDLDTAGIDSTVKSIKDLSSGIAELSGIGPSLQKISSSMQRIGKIDLEKLGLKVTPFSEQVKSLITQLNGVGKIKFSADPVRKLISSFSSLMNLDTSGISGKINDLVKGITQLRDGVKDISFSGIDVSGLTAFMRAISALGGKSATTAASGNIDKLAVALKNMMITLSAAPRISNNIIQMTQALAQLASAGGKAGTATRSLASGFNVFSTSSGKAAKSAGGLAAAFGRFYATYWLLLRSLGLFKNAIDISSDLTEVQNVVDVTFGHMSDTMNEFADSALQNYGMSELMAKQIASRFQAMGVSMGFAQDEMSDMSIELTRLAGDMASFYNVSQEQIATSLQSIFTGETEPLMLAA